MNGRTGVRFACAIALASSAIGFGLTSAAGADDLTGWTGTVHATYNEDFSNGAGLTRHRDSDVLLQVGGNSAEGDGLVRNGFHYWEGGPCPSPYTGNSYSLAQIDPADTRLVPGALLLNIDRQAGSYEVGITGSPITPWDRYNETRDCGEAPIGETVPESGYLTATYAPCHYFESNNDLPLPSNWDGLALSGSCSYTQPVAPSGQQTWQIDWDLTREPLQLSVLKASIDGGSGRVSSSPGPIDCGPTCDATFVPGTSVTLTANAQPGSYFVGWSGDCSGLLLECTVLMDKPRSVTATFRTFSSLVGGETIAQTWKDGWRQANLFFFITGGAFGSVLNPVSEGIGLTLEAAALEGGFISWVLGDDPPDPNFTQIAQPVSPTPFKIKPSRSLNRKAVRALTKVAANGARSYGFGIALLHCIERAQGAAIARDEQWRQKQRGCAAANAEQLAQTFNEQARLRRGAKKALIASHIPNLRISRGAITHSRAALERGQLAGSFARVANSLGLDAGQRQVLINNLREIGPPRGRPRLLDLVYGPDVQKALKAAEATARGVANQFSVGAGS